MASRRKYKSGGRVPVVDEPVSMSVDVSPPSPAPSIAAPETDDAIARAVAASLHAEKLTRQAHARQAQRAQEPSVSEYIDQLPGLSDHKRQFLKANPHFVRDRAQQGLMAEAYQEAIRSGVADDTLEMDAAIRSGVAARQERARQQRELASTPLQFDEPAPAPTRPAPPPAAPAPMQRAPQVDTAPPPEIKRSMPITAPVSREVPTSNGQRMQDFRTMTLSAEERVIARNSFIDPNMSNEQKELLYARNKARLMQMRANGSYTE